MVALGAWPSFRPRARSENGRCRTEYGRGTRCHREGCRSPSRAYLRVELPAQQRGLAFGGRPSSWADVRAGARAEARARMADAFAAKVGPAIQGMRANGMSL